MSKKAIVRRELNLTMAKHRPIVHEFIFVNLDFIDLRSQDRCALLPAHVVRERVSLDQCAVAKNHVRHHFISGVSHSQSLVTRISVANDFALLAVLNRFVVNLADEKAF